MAMKKAKLAASPAVVGLYETDIEFDCPVRGRVKQRVVVKRYESLEPSVPVEEILPKKSITDDLDRQYGGLVLADDSLDNTDEEIN